MKKHWGVEVSGQPHVPAALLLVPIG